MNRQLKSVFLGIATSFVASAMAQNADTSSTTQETLNPPVAPTVSHGSDLFVNVDVLLWKARETGLDYATRTTFLPPQGTSGSVKTPKFHWDTGFRFGLGYNLPYDGWDLFLNWTHFNDEAKGSTSANPSFNQSILPMYEPIIMQDQLMMFTSAKSHLNLIFNMIDLELGRDYLVSRRLSLRPYVGVRAAWIHQHFTVHSAGNIKAFETTTNSLGQVVINQTQIPTFSKEKLQCEFDGIGPRIGIGSDFLLGGGVSLFGDAAISLLLGQFTTSYNANVNTFVTTTITNPDGIPTGTQTKQQIGSSKIHDNFRDSRFAIDLALGARWQQKFCNDAFRLRLQVGWDQHYFLNQNQFIATQNQIVVVQSQNPTQQPPGLPVNSKHKSKTLRRGDLSLQGVTFTARFDF